VEYEETSEWNNSKEREYFLAEYNSLASIPLAFVNSKNFL
jgi:hypothetical protein